MRESLVSLRENLAVQCGGTGEKEKKKKKKKKVRFFSLVQDTQGDKLRVPL